MTASPNTQTISADSGSTATFNIYTNSSSWNATSTESWLTLDINTSAGILIAYAEENTSADLRSTAITVTATGADDAIITIIQNGTSPIYYLDVSPDYQTISHDSGATSTFNVYTNLGT